MFRQNSIRTFTFPNRKMRGKLVKMQQHCLLQTSITCIIIIEELGKKCPEKIQWNIQWKNDKPNQSRRQTYYEYYQHTHFPQNDWNQDPSKYENIWKQDNDTRYMKALEQEQHKSRFAGFQGSQKMIF